MNYPIKLAFFIILGSIATSSIFASKLSITNNSTWKIKVSYTKHEKKISKTLEPNGDTFILGENDTFGDITIESYGKIYGKIWGLLARPKKISLDDLKFFPNGDANIKITTEMGGWKFTERPLEKHSKSELPKSGNPYDAFPAAKRAKELGREIQPRHILGVGENATEEDVKAAYKVLSLKYNPDKNPDNKEFATRIFKILKTAYDELMEQFEHKLTVF